MKEKELNISNSKRYIHCRVQLKYLVFICSFAYILLQSSSSSNPSTRCQCEASMRSYFYWQLLLFRPMNFTSERVFKFYKKETILISMFLLLLLGQIVISTFQLSLQP